MAAQTKYRPSLPAKAIQHILALAKAEDPMSVESMQVIAILAPFEAKIANNCITPAYQTKGKPSVEESLGMIENTETRSKEAIYADSYYKWKEDPTNCSLLEIEQAQEHRYLNDMMDPTEERVYEANSKL
jgi:hypothetical protein